MEYEKIPTFYVSFKFSEETNNNVDLRNNLVERFCDRIDIMKLQFGGGGHGSTWSGYVEPTEIDPTDEHRKAITEWLENEPLVLIYHVGPIEYQKPFGEEAIEELKKTYEELFGEPYPDKDKDEDEDNIYF